MNVQRGVMRVLPRNDTSGVVPCPTVYALGSSAVLEVRVDLYKITPHLRLSIRLHLTSPAHRHISE
jgi:hypothetical protein